MLTVNKTPGEVVIVLVCLFLLIVRRSRSCGTRQSSRRCWDGSQAWVVLPPLQMLSDTCTAIPIISRAPPGRGSAARLWMQRARSLQEHFLQEYYSFLKKQIFSETNPAKVLLECWLSSSSLHTRGCTRTHTRTHTCICHSCPNLLAVPTSFQLPLLSSAPI